MKKTSLFFALILAFLSAFSQASEMKFTHSDWKTTLAEAKQANKFIFLDAHTSWCVPCKWMAANVFTDPSVAEFFNQNFINAKIDMEKGEGPELRNKYGVNAFPTLLFIDGDGNLVHSEEGTREVDEFIDLGKMVLDPEFVSIVALAKRFDAGERDRTCPKNYLMRMSNTAEGLQEVLEPFKAGMQGEGLLDENSWTVFQAYFLNSETEIMQYFMANRPAFESKYGLEVVNQKVYDVYFEMGNRASNAKDEAAFLKARQLAANSGIPRAAALVCNMEIRWYGPKNDVPNYLKAVNTLFELPGEGSIHEKKFQAMIVSRACDKPEDLMHAYRWSQDVVAVEQDYYALHTYAFLQLKLGKIEEGMANAKKAIAAAIEEGEDYSQTEAAMEKYKAQ